MRGKRRGFHPGQRLDAPGRFRIQIRHRFAARIFRHRQRHLHGEDVVRIETGIDVLQTREALHEQPGADEEDERQRHFRDRRARCATRLRRTPVVEPRPPSFSASVNSGLPLASAGTSPKRMPVTTETTSVTTRTLKSRFVSAMRGTVCAPIDAQEIEAPDRQHRAERAADESEQDAFAKHLPHELETAGAERDANGELALPRSGARQQHGGEIRAGDEENDRDRA